MVQRLCTSSLFRFLWHNIRKISIGTDFHLLTYKWILHISIRPNVPKTKQLEQKQSQKMKCMPTDTI